jgi:hypothetical protein
VRTAKQQADVRGPFTDPLNYEFRPVRLGARWRAVSSLTALARHSTTHWPPETRG